MFMADAAELGPEGLLDLTPIQRSSTYATSAEIENEGFARLPSGIC